MEEEILKDIENIEETGSKNEIFEVDENEEIINHQYENLNDDNNDLKLRSKRGKKRWSKKQVVILVVVILVLLLAIIAGILLLNKNKDDDKPKEDLGEKAVEKGDYIYDNGKLIFINDKKDEIGTYTCENKNEELCYIANFSNEDDFDIAIKVYEDDKRVVIRSNIFFNNYVFVYDEAVKDQESIKLYDIAKKKVVETYDLVKEISEDKVIVRKDKKYGVISFKEDNYNEDVKFNYDYLGYILDSDYLVAAKNNNYQLIDFEGESVSESVPGEIKNYDKDNISVKSGSKYYVYDYLGEKRIESTYNYIKFADSYFIGVDSSNKLYVYDKDGYIMNGEGIKVTGTTYNPKLIYDEKLHQTGKEEAFNAYVTGSTIRIEYDEDYTTINTNEGNYNKTLSYINYFAGKLYFYSDEEKTNLLGTYACNYANAVGASNEELENCFIAKETNLFKKGEDLDNGYLPIFNNRFVFISDTKSPKANDNIILYDLEKKKKLATYKEVDAGYHKDPDSISFVETAGNNVIAKNSNDSYGLINILKSSVKGIIAFKDTDTGATNESISMLESNILFRRSDKTYHLYNLKGTEITKNIHTTSEIVDYINNYVVVNNNSNYVIYDLAGKIVTTKEDFKYVKLYDKFYVSVNKDGLINAYKYNGVNPLNIDDGTNTAINTNYAKSFTVFKEDEVYKLAILKTDGSYNSVYELSLTGE